MTTRILAIGDVAVDIILGPLVGLPGWGEEIEAPTVETRLGGNTGNFCVAARELGLAVDCISVVGDDANGRLTLNDLTVLGCSTTHVQVTADSATCVSIGFFRQDGERLFVTHPGAVHRLGAYLEGLEPPAADVAIFSGWCQPPRVNVEVLQRLVADLKRKGTRTAFDLSWHDETWRRKDELIAILTQADMVLLNRDELTAIVGAGALDDALAALTSLLGAGPTVVVKAGADGAAAKRGNQPIVRAAVPTQTAASAVGAGDSFNAGFIAATFVHHHDLAAASAFACDFATRSITLGRRSPAGQLPNNLSGVHPT